MMRKQPLTISDFTGVNRCRAGWHSFTQCTETTLLTNKTVSTLKKVKVFKALQMQPLNERHLHF